MYKFGNNYIYNKDNYHKAINDQYKIEYRDIKVDVKTHFYSKNQNYVPPPDKCEKSILVDCNKIILTQIENWEFRLFTITIISLLHLKSVNPNVKLTDNIDAIT